MAAPTDFERYQPAIMPYWARRANGQAYWQSLGKVKDQLVSTTKQAVKSRMPGLAPLDALDLIGGERGLPRYRFGTDPQTDAEYRATVASAWDLWYWGGTAKGMMDELYRAFRPYHDFAIVTQQGRIWTRAAGDAGATTFVDTGPRWFSTNFWNRFHLWFLHGLIDPLVLQVPVAGTPVSSAHLGGLGAGTYSWRVSAINAVGETLASAAVGIVNFLANRKFTIPWGEVAGATGYKVYGRTAGSELLIATVGAGVLSYDDTGGVPAGALPTVNTAISSDTSQAANTTRDIISRWRPGHALCDRITVVAEGYPWGYPGILWGTPPPTNWGEPSTFITWTPP